jgi:hypothetical protein
VAGSPAYDPYATWGELLDHLIGGGQQCFGNIEGVSAVLRLMTNSILVGGLFAAQDAVDVSCSLGPHGG